MTSPMRIGFTLLKNADTSPLSPHFGMAKWLGIYDTETGLMRFERNAGLNGRSVADAFARAGCTHAVFTHIGAPALGHLEAHRIRGFWGNADQPATALVIRLQRGELRPAESTAHPGGRGRHVAHHQ